MDLWFGKILRNPVLGEYLRASQPCKNLVRYLNIKHMGRSMNAADTEIYDF